MVDPITCMAVALFFEARNQPFDGKLAVGHVIENRVESPAYPDTVCEVVFQNSHRFNRCQFSFACDGLSDDPTKYDTYYDAKAWEQAQLAAILLDVGVEDTTNGSTHYHADYVTPSWAAKIEFVSQVGDHLFYVEG